MKKLSNTEAKLKRVLLKKQACNQYSCKTLLILIRKYILSIYLSIYLSIHTYIYVYIYIYIYIYRYIDIDIDI